jgi:hypothetical protein
MSIDPSNKGWLAQTANFRKTNLNEIIREHQKASSSLLSMYQAIQPVGLLNGQLFGQMNYPHSDTWNSYDATKVLFADCLISSSLLLFDNKKIQDDAVVDAIIAKAINNISKFYNSVYPEYKVSSRSIFGQKKLPNELAELILEKRIRNVVEGKHKFVEQFFHNGLLFLDIYTFSRWINTQGDEIATGLFKTLLEELRFSVLKIIAAAAHANKEIASEEKNFLDYFLSSAPLPMAKVNEAKSIFQNGIEVRDLDLHPDNTWVVKKYFLEMAIITIWADKVIDPEEMDFLERFRVYLGMNQSDLKNSLLSIKELVPTFDWQEV